MGYNTSPLSLFHPHRRWGAMNDYSIMSSTVSQHLIGFERAQGLKWRWHGKTNEEPKRNHQDPHVHRKALNLPSFVSQSRFPGYTATSTYRDEYSRGLENSACISQNRQPNLSRVLIGLKKIAGNFTLCGDFVPPSETEYKKKKCG